MNVSLGENVEKELGTGWSDNIVERKDNENRDFYKFMFTNCRNVKQVGIKIQTNSKSPSWQVGFFDADGEVYFNKIIIGECGNFSSVVRNYWWNGKRGNEKKEGYYSLIKSVKQLDICKEHINDLLDYVKGRHEVGEHWQIHELDRNMKLRIENEVEETSVERLSQYFDNIWCQCIAIDLKTVNNITYSCNWYKFTNCKGIVPQKLVINATVEYIMRFQDANNEVHIPEIVMEKKADLKSIIQNYYGDKKYSLLPHIQTLIIRNNPNVLCDLADYINGRYKTYNNYWMLHQLNKNMKIMIEKPGIAFDAVKEISDYFVNVTVDNHEPEEYLARRQPYQKQFQEHFDKYDLKTNLIKNVVAASQELELDQNFNVAGSNREINKLYVNQKLAPQQLICFHDTGKFVVIDKIVIYDDGDLRCVLQNAYYNGTDSSFFSLLQTAKELEIHSNYTRDNQVLVDLADYVEGKYALNANWKEEELDKDIRITINSGKHSLSLSIAQRLRSYFRNISIDRILAPLETENVTDQECGDSYIFTNSTKINPKKLVINAKITGCKGVILFDNTDSEICIPEITIGEHGGFDAIVRNKWRSSKNSNERKKGYYSLISHVETLSIQNNLGAVCNLADYINGDYEVKSEWSIQKLDKKIKIRIENIGIIQNIPDAQNKVEKIKKIKEYFDDVIVRGHQFTFLDLGLRTAGLNNAVEVQSELTLVGNVYNIMSCKNAINALIVDQNLETDQLICFHDISRPISVDILVIRERGNLRNLVQNAYYSGGQYGFFSLIETCGVLEIHGNVQATKDLADYVESKYEPHPKWRLWELGKDMVIRISSSNSGLPLETAQRLREYFSNVSIDVIQTELQAENIIDQECENWYVFVSSGQVSPQKLTVNARLGGSGTLILFEQADNEVQIPEITIGERGSFASVVRNQWRNSRCGDDEKGGYYSLVHHAKDLRIVGNSQAICDLAGYIEKQYDAGPNWPHRELSEALRIAIENPGGDLQPIKTVAHNILYTSIEGRPFEKYVQEAAVGRLGEYWGRFSIKLGKYDLQVEGYEHPLNATAETNLAGSTLHVRESSKGMQTLTVNKKSSKTSACFHNVGASVEVNSACIGAGRNLCNMVQNAYFDGEKGGLFSLLSKKAQHLVDYIEGRYELNRNLEVKTPNRSVRGSAKSLNPVAAKGIKVHSDKVHLPSIRTPLQQDNVIDQECERYELTVQDGVVPKTLTVNTAVTGQLTLLAFIGAAGEVHVPELVIGTQGAFDVLVRNCWQGGDHVPHNYSLVRHATKLTIVDNQDAVRDLADYVAENPLDRQLELLIRVSGPAIDPVRMLAERIQGVTATVINGDEQHCLRPENLAE